MAEVVNAIPGPARQNRDFGRFFDGQIWKLTAGVDCHADIRTAAGALCNAAKRLGVRVNVSQRKKENAIYVQAIKD